MAEVMPEAMCQEPSVYTGVQGDHHVGAFLDTSECANTLPDEARQGHLPRPPEACICIGMPPLQSVVGKWAQWHVRWHEARASGLVGDNAPSLVEGHDVFHAEGAVTSSEDSDDSAGAITTCTIKHPVVEAEPGNKADAEAKQEARTEQLMRLMRAELQSGIPNAAIDAYWDQSDGSMTAASDEGSELMSMSEVGARRSEGEAVQASGLGPLACGLSEGWFWEQTTHKLVQVRSFWEQTPSSW
jgi:hypothetical protein